MLAAPTSDTSWRPSLSRSPPRVVDLQEGLHPASLASGRVTGRGSGQGSGHQGRHCTLTTCHCLPPQLPGRRYSPGYNADVGDKWIWLK